MLPKPKLLFHHILKPHYSSLYIRTLIFYVYLALKLLPSSPSLSSHAYIINHNLEFSQVSTHKAIRNKRTRKAALESQYVLGIGNQHEAESKVSDTIEHEIGCPRCYNVMTLCSNFDSLYYLCEECDFSFYTLK